jgi:hypothetical protein
VIKYKLKPEKQQDRGVRLQMEVQHKDTILSLKAWLIFRQAIYLKQIGLV